MQRGGGEGRGNQGQERGVAGAIRGWSEGGTTGGGMKGCQGRLRVKNHGSRDCMGAGA
jgi:hypothetical protein